MKKAKIMLMAIAVLAVVGGALAFKAKKHTAYTFFGCATSNIGGQLVSGCFSPYVTTEFMPTFFGRSVIPYNSFRIRTTCFTLPPGLLAPCGSSFVTINPFSE